MKLVTIKQLAVAAVIAAVFALNACQKEKVVNPTKPHNNASTIDSKATFNDVNSTYMDVVSLVEAINNGSFEGKKESTCKLLSSCAIVTIDSSAPIRKADIDFGTGCLDNNGDFHSGQIHVEYNSTSIRTSGTQITATFTNFMNINNEYNGTLDIHNTGPNGSGNPVIVLTANLSKVDHSDNTMLNFTVNLSHEWITGSTTQLHDDDAISVTGSITGNDGNGTNFSYTIITPLILSYAPTCIPVFNTGKYDFQAGIDPTETMDFGDGTCDDLAYHIVDGDTTVITID